MRHLYLCFVLILACETQTDSHIPQAPQSEKTFKNLKRGTEQRFTYFSFSKGDTLLITGPQNSQEWDVAFGAHGMYTMIKTNSGSSGIGNGGAIVYSDSLYSKITSVPDADFAVDQWIENNPNPAIPIGSGNSWYTYKDQRIYINPRHVIIIRTADGNYAKLKILNYYLEDENGVSNFNKPRYISFKYIYQPNKESKHLN